MGFFSRRGAAPEDGHEGTPRRVPMSSEVQANELRIKARRRLIGAVTLVLAAIIVLPMVLDSEPVPIPDDIIAIPERGTGLPPLASAGTAATAGLGMPEPAAQGNAATANPDTGAAAAPIQTTPATAQPSTPPAAVPAQTVTQPPRTPAPNSATATQPQQPARTASPTANTPPTTATQPNTPPARNTAPADDQEALVASLLEARDPDAAAARLAAQRRGTSQAAAPAASQEKLVLQIAAYSTDEDAQARRRNLYEAGVTNAFVQRVMVNGKPAFRLRVGPFSSRDAAQAAQTRLRTLGYNNSFITAQ